MSEPVATALRSIPVPHEEGRLLANLGRMDQLQFYVINLARSPDRRAAMKRRLDALGIAHAFFDGVDASKGEHLPVFRVMR